VRTEEEIRDKKSRIHERGNSPRTEYAKGWRHALKWVLNDKEEKQDVH